MTRSDIMSELLAAEVAAEDAYLDTAAVTAILAASGSRVNRLQNDLFRLETAAKLGSAL